MPKKGQQKPLPGDASDPDGLIAWLRRYLDQLRVRGYADSTIATADDQLRIFIRWAFDRAITRPAEVTKPMLERYQRHLFYYRTAGGKPLSFASQRARVQRVQGFFKWLAKNNVILSNPASDLELPRSERRIPRAILNEREVEKVLGLADTTDVLGLRDRAIMEVLYSTGIRRSELAALELFDVDHDRGTLTVRHGKGRRQRVVPIGERALSWMGRYLSESRPELLVPPDPLKPARLTHLMSGYIERARLGKTGACHIFRHTMATLMLEGGADIRLIQEMLGHALTSTTQIYTRVSIKHLKLAHDIAHPGAKLERRERTGIARQLELDLGEPTAEQQLLNALDAEAGEEKDPDDEP
jgi:integrase/recombinase XerD